MTAGIHEEVVAQRPENRRLKSGRDVVRAGGVGEPIQSGDLSVVRVFPKQLDGRVVASETKPRLHLPSFGEKRRGEHVGVQQRSIGQHDVAVTVYGAEQAAADEVSGSFQPVEQGTYRAITRFDGRVQLVVLPLVTRQAGLRTLERLCLELRFDMIGCRRRCCRASRLQNTQSNPQDNRESRPHDKFATLHGPHPASWPRFYSTAEVGIAMKKAIFGSDFSFLCPWGGRAAGIGPRRTTFA